MANHRVLIMLALTVCLIWGVAAEAYAGEANCEDVKSPISGTSYRGLIWRAIDLGATKADLYTIVSNSRCRLYLENIIDQSFKKEP